jgi:hypothetical protein
LLPTEVESKDVLVVAKLDPGDAILDLTVVVPDETVKAASYYIDQEYLGRTYFRDREQTTSTWRPFLQRYTSGRLYIMHNGKWRLLSQLGQSWHQLGVNGVLDRPRLARTADFDAFVPQEVINLQQRYAAHLLRVPTVCQQEPLQWTENRRGQFTVIYSPQDLALGRSFFSYFGRSLEADMVNYQRLFGVIPPTPITFRIYPTLDYYHCLNPFAPELSPGQMHTRLGTSEIALIGSAIVTNPSELRQQVAGVLHYEMALLHAQQLALNGAPPGLLAGASYYVKEPTELLAEILVAPETLLDPRLSWRALWESDVSRSSRLVGLRSMTIVAYLADVYGWPAFLEFLRELATSSGYRQALVDTYGIDLTDLQAQWQVYYPAFFAGRWRANVLYEFDLGPFRQLVEAGAYDDAIVSLSDAITFLEGMGETEKVVEATELLATAEAGKEIGQVVRQARLALQNKEYQTAIVLADEAEQSYREIGDQRRLAELESYRSWAQEVLDLQERVVPLQAKLITDGDDPEAVAQMITIAQRLSELGDTETVAGIEAGLESVTRRRRDRMLERLEKMVILVLLLLLARVVYILKRPPAEARLA